MVELQIVVLAVAGSSPVGHPPSEIRFVPVAQPDRASDFGSEGWGFESLQARVLSPAPGSLLPARARTRYSENGMNDRAALDTTVVNIELTLASIIQGVALYFLTENARAVLSWQNWPTLLYVAAGLCIIFIFWSRSIIHTLTLIKWPLEFGHNFFYIACALGEAILFTRLDRPPAWFALSAAYAAAVWLLFSYDMRLIRARLNEARDDSERAFYRRTQTDQSLNIRFLIPLLFLFNLGCALLIHFRSELFIERGGHVWLIGAQLLSFIGYLVYVTRFFSVLAPAMVKKE
jgi:hypothetical protein